MATSANADSPSHSREVSDSLFFFVVVVFVFLLIRPQTSGSTAVRTQSGACPSCPPAKAFPERFKLSETRTAALIGELRSFARRPNLDPLLRYSGSPAKLFTLKSSGCLRKEGLREVVS